MYFRNKTIAQLDSSTLHAAFNFHFHFLTTAVAVESYERKEERNSQYENYGNILDTEKSDFVFR